MSKRFRAMRHSQPIRMWIDGTCYNIESKSERNKRKGLPADHESYKIAEDADGRMFTKFSLPKEYYKKININIVNDIKKRTGADLKIPKDGEEGSIEISGDGYDKVAEARVEIHEVCSQIKQTLAPLQFLGIPTLSEEVKGNFIKFRDEILNSGVNIRGLEEAVFQKPTKLHLTVTVFSLLDEREIEAAKKTLDAFKEEVLAPLLNGRKLNIRLRGLECMTQNHREAHVLFARAKFEEPGIALQDVVNKMASYFDEKGLSKEGGNSVKIHVTLINTKYRNSKDGPKKRRIPFNAEYIMDRYADHDFGVAPFDSVHLSLMGSKGEDGFYLPVATVQI